MEVPGDIKGELCNMKTHLDQRNGTISSTLLLSLTLKQRGIPGVSTLSVTFRCYLTDTRPTACHLVLFTVKGQVQMEDGVNFNNNLIKLNLL